ncbi:RhoGAP-domain-containing protein [Armillaria gallica]|uniref:RhoGAP-domain-containing protein n=1 Tax=Armillaria gallica TaxID=47427 RepID=A0A2H3E6J6_ARMGA|nr:RhoGAP-domain-containing protein [Armillaria gallica]
MSSRIPSSSTYSTSVHPSPVRPSISSASSSTTSLQTSSTNTLPPAPGVVTVEAVLAQHSASFDPKLAALEQSLNERNTLSLQNAQLWKLIEKQRSGYNQILKELERVRSERDGYKSRLAASHNSPHSDRRHRNHDRTHQPAPAPSESPVPSSESGSLNEEHTPVTKHSTHRHRSDEQATPRLPTQSLRSTSSQEPIFPDQSPFADSQPVSQFSQRTGPSSLPPLVVPPRSESLPVPASIMSAPQDTTPFQQQQPHHVYSDSVVSSNAHSGSSTMSTPSRHQAYPRKSSITESISSVSTAGASFSSTPPPQQSSHSPSYQAGFTPQTAPAGFTSPPTQPPSLTIYNSPTTPVPSQPQPSSSSALSVDARQLSRESRITLPDEASNYIANMVDSPVPSPRFNDNFNATKSPLAGIANGGAAPSDPDHSSPITPDSQKKSEFLDMDEDPPDEDEEEEDTDERDAYDAVEPGNPGPTPVQSTSPTSPHGRKIKPRAAAEDFPLPPSNINSQKQAQAVARARAAATVSSPQRPSGYDYPDPDQAQIQPPQQDQREMPNVPAFRALPLLSTDLPRTTINVSHSFVRPNDRGKEVLSFVVEVNPGSGKDGWKVEKMYSDVLNLDQRVRNSVGKGVGKKIANLPEGKLWKDHAPAKVDQRKAVLQNYLQTLIKLPVKNNDEVIAFFTSDIMREMNQPVMQAGHKEGYLTKRGKNFGGWKTRYFVLQGPVLEYYDCRGGAHLGSITVTGAQIGRQQRTERPTTTDEEKEYRHAFLIVEAKKGQGGNHPRHVLCAESDADRDSWVEMLVRYFSGTYSEEAVPYSSSSSSSGPYTNGTSSVTLSEATSTSTSSPVPVRRPVRGVSKDDISVSKQAAVPISRLAPDASNAKLFSGPVLPDEYNSTITRSSSPSKSVQEASPTERYPGPAISDALNARRILERGQGLASSLPDSSPLASAIGASGTDRSHSELGHYSDTPRITRSPERHREREHKSLHPSPTPDRDRAPSPEGKVKISGPLNGAPIPAGYKFGSGRDPQGESGSDRREKAKSRGFWGFGRPNGAEKPPLPRPVFGVTLEESLEVSSVAHLPSIVFRAIQYLEAKNAEQEEGIYRLSGSSAVIKNLKDMFNAEGDIDLLASDEYWDPHAIAGLLKSFLRELPASILTRELHLDFLAVMERKDPQERVRTLSHLIASLPIANYSLLRALTAHLILIVQNSAVNKMSMRNVGIVFSPTLGIPAGVFSLMLGEFNQVFNVEDVEEELEELAEDSRRNSRQYTDGAADQLLGLTGRTLSAPVESDGEYSSSVADDTDRESAVSGPDAGTPPDTPRLGKAAGVAATHGLNVAVSERGNRYSRIVGGPRAPPSPAPSGSPVPL